jgi:beta-glucosidase
MLKTYGLSDYQTGFLLVLQRRNRMFLHGKSLHGSRMVAILLALAMCLTPLASYPTLAAPPQKANPAPAQQSNAWGTGTLTDAEIHDLISQMTLAEETSFVHGATDDTCSNANVSNWVKGCVGQAGYIPGVARLGIPPMRFTDGPAGVRLNHQETAMPAPVGLAATFDRNAAKQFGTVVGREGRATNQDILLAPMINQVVIPTAGRNFETLGEDPYLEGQMVAPEVKGVQSQGLIATLKHYAMNDFENGRGSTSVDINEQPLHEMELQAFHSGVNAGAGAVMCSYNRINDVYGCGNDILLNQILKGLFNFGGWVMSDWGATHRISDLMHGLDDEMPRGRNLSDSALANAVANGTSAVALSNDFPAEPAYSGAQWKAAIDASVFRILKQMNNAGLLEGTEYGSHYNGSTPTPYVPPRPDLQALQPGDFSAAQSIAEESAVLLKNDGNALPLKHTDLFSNGKKQGVLVMGPTAIAPYTGGGGSAHVTPFDPVQSPYDALTAAAGTGAKINYVPGYDLDGQVLPSSALNAPDTSNPYQYWTLTPADAAFSNQPGMLRQQVVSSTIAISGTQPTLYSGADAAPDQLDQTVNYTGGNALPVNTAWRWTGTFTAPSAGNWQLKIFVKNQASAALLVDGLSTGRQRCFPGFGCFTIGGGDQKINIGSYPAFPHSSYAGLTEESRSHDPSAPTLEQSTYSVDLTAGQVLHLDLRLVTGATDPTQIQLRWIPPNNQTQAINNAVSAAKNAKKVIIFAYDEGTEGRDRGGNDPAAGMVLPGYQDALISAVAAVNPNTVVVLNTGDPVFMPWVKDVKSILEMWYPGQMGGPATADLLMGNANPGGKLPVTFPADATHYPQYDPNCTDTSTNGNCPLYPGVAQTGFLGTDPHSYRTIDFTTNGIFVGYRWYDKHNVQPLFEFGHGLSYTKFKYSKLSINPASDGGFDINFRVQNVGNDAGAEVPQVYVGPSPDAPTRVQQAVKKLVQFDRIVLDPGHWQDVTLHVTQHELSYWSTTTNDWAVGTGKRTVYVGSSSRDIRLQGSVQVSQ